MKKIMTILAATMVALMLVGCADVGGVGSATGLKTNKTVNVDATAANTRKPMPEGKVWRRYLKQLGDSEKVAEITTTITLDTSKCTLTGDNNKQAKIGYVFDLNKPWDTANNKPAEDPSDSKPRDFCILGINPLNGKAYIEHYSGVDLKEELDTDEAGSAIGASDSNIFGGGGWADLPSGSYTVEGTVYTFEVRISQTNKGTYSITLGGKPLGTYTASGHYMDNGFAIGGVGAYVNCPKGGKVTVNYKTEQSSVTGKFFVDEEEYVEEF